MSRHIPTAAALLGVLLLLGTRVELATQTVATKQVQIDRQYTLEATMLGYRGVGGEIDGIRNPTLVARSPARRCASPSSTAS